MRLSFFYFSEKQAGVCSHLEVLSTQSDDLQSPGHEAQLPSTLIPSQAEAYQPVVDRFHRVPQRGQRSHGIQDGTKGGLWD
jgi:hypothetical protein